MKQIVLEKVRKNGDPEKILIVPNPLLNTLDPTFSSKTPVDISIRDVSGKRVFYEHLEKITKSEINFEHQIAVSHLASGIYFLNLSKDNKVFVEKFIKELLRKLESKTNQKFQCDETL